MLMRSLVLLTLVVAMVGCNPGKPTKKMCAAACNQSFELHREHVIKMARASAGDDDKKAEENVAKAKAEWENLKKSGRENKRIEDCTVTCMAEGKRDEVECMMSAKSIPAVRQCKKGSPRTKK